MAYLSHYELAKYVPAGKMPLGVVYMYRGSKRSRHFHDHNHSEIAIVLKGSCRHLFEGQSVVVKPGDVLVIHPGATHTYDQFDQLELVNIIYDMKRLCLPILDGVQMPLFRILFPDDPGNVYRSGEPVVHLAPDALGKIAAMIQTIDFELKSSRQGRYLYCLSIFLEIVVILCRIYSGEDHESQEKEIPFRIGEAVEYMNAHYQDPVSVDQMARKACMSRRNFYLQFKNATGCSPVQYLIKLRVSRAMEMLLYSEMRISDIAEKCGFCDSNYFCKIFRSMTGLPPRQYRQRNHV